MKNIAIIGSGIMGSGIAAQLANNDCNVILYDMKDENNNNISEKSLKNLSDPKNNSLIHQSKLKNIFPASLEDDINKISECDIIIEAIIENIDIKKSLYKNIAKYMKKDAILASNTSTFSLKNLKSELDSETKNRMAIVHFFNPPRYMKLLELVVDENFPKNLKEDLTEFLTKIAGKTVIYCKDTPGFIANRIGCFLMDLACSETLLSSCNHALIDLYFTKYLSLPKTSIFGLYDLIGIDVMRMINDSLTSNLENDDYYQNLSITKDFLDNMISKNLKGRKSGSGFYKLTKLSDGSRINQILDLKNFEYNNSEIFKLEPETLQDIIKDNKKESVIFKKILAKFLAYVISISKDISYDVHDIDRAMKLGYAFSKGPLEIASMIDNLDDFIKENLEIKAKDSELYSRFKENLDIIENLNKEKLSTSSNSLKKLTFDKTPEISNKSANLWDLGKKLCFEITTKQNILDENIFNLLSDSIDIAEKKDKELIIYSDAKNFSAGANLKYFYDKATSNDKETSKNDIENLLKLGQNCLKKIKYSKIPIISCAKGFALGGGTEILLHSDYIISHQDLSAGLVETSIGLIPGWGGVKEMILRSKTIDEFYKNLSLIIESTKSSSSLNFKELYDTPNLISIANDNLLLETALSMNFEKSDKNYKMNLMVEFDTKYSNNQIYKTIFEKLWLIDSVGQSYQSLEDAILKIEREIFIDLLFKQDTISKISKFI